MQNPKMNCKRFEQCLNNEKIWCRLFGDSYLYDCGDCMAYQSTEMIPLLKPCPFCGGEAEIKRDTTCMGHGDYGSSKWVKCKGCGARTKIYLCDGYYGCECTDEELAEKWNRRLPYEPKTEK